MTAGDYLLIKLGWGLADQYNRHTMGGYVVADVINPRKRKKIVADYVTLGSYAAAARINGVAPNSVLAYMGKQSDLVCDIIGKGLTALADDDKLAAANPAQITTAIGTLIDKWTMVRDRQTQSGVQVNLGDAEEYSG